MNPYFTGPLYPYQQQAFEFALGKVEAGIDRGCGLWLGLGTGKTRTALRLVCALIEMNVIGPQQVAFAVCPKAVIPSWVSETDQVTNLDIVALEGSKKQRLNLLDCKVIEEPDIYVTNFDALRVLERELVADAKNGRFPLMIFDESQRLSNRTTTQAKISTKLAEHARFSLLLSGTPVRNDATDLFSQIYIMDGGKRLGANFWGFRARYFVNVSRNPSIPNWVPKSGSEDEIREKISDIALRIKKEDVLPFLPPKIFTRRDLEMTPRQKEAYRSMAKDLLVELKLDENEGKVATAQNVLTRYLRLSQIAQGFLFDEENEHVEEFTPNPKTNELLEILKEHAIESNNKVVIWVQFRHTLHALMKLLKEYNPVALYGDTSGDGVDKVFQSDPSVRVLIGTQQAGGLGVTLTQADLVVFFTNNWSHELRLQAEDRSHRIGSEKVTSTVQYIDLVCRGSLDERVLAVLQKKADTAELLTSLRNHIEAVALNQEEQ